MCERVVVHQEQLPSDSLPTEFYAFVHKDPEKLIKDLIDSPEVSLDLCPESFICWREGPVCKGHLRRVCHPGMRHVLRIQPIFDGNNNRVYSDFASGQWLEKTQVVILFHPFKLFKAVLLRVLVW